MRSKNDKKNTDMEKSTAYNETCGCVCEIGLSVVHDNLVDALQSHSWEVARNFKNERKALVKVHVLTSERVWR